MPTFDFACDKCGHTFEFSRPYGSKVHPPCPKCKHKKTKKLISPPLIQFRGSGFYKTDSEKVHAPKKAETKDTTGTKDAPKPAEKPAEKKEAKAP